MSLSAISRRLSSGLDASPDGSHRRGWALAASVGAAVAFNMLALGAVAAVVLDWQAPGSSTTSPAPRVTVVSLTARSTSVRDDRVPIEPTRSPPAMTRQRPHEIETERPARLPPAIQSPVPSSAPHETGAFGRFFRSNEVDRPAEPDSDWNLDTATLDALGIERVVFDIFIDRDGTVLSSDILEPSEIDGETRQALEARLRDTLAMPAIRQGATVASVRRIEVSVLPALR